VKVRAFLLITALFAGMSVAGGKYVAVVETGIDEQSGAAADLTSAEVRLITAELRREAVKNLPRSQYSIMTTETVYAQGTAVLLDCADENCVISLGSKIGADYIVRGTISKLRTRFTLTVEIYETEDGNLVASSDPVRSESIEELVEKAAAACAGMYRAFASSQAGVAQSQPAAAPAKAPVPPPPVNYTLTAAANPPDGGAVSRNPDKPQYAPGANVNVMANPASGYRFTGWSGDAAGAASLKTVTMDGNKKLTANFQQITYKLTTNVTPPEGGHITRNPDREAYPANERVTVIAVPARGYALANWNGKSDGSTSSLMITMSGDKSVTAIFSKESALKPESAAPIPKPEPIPQDPAAVKRKLTIAGASLDALGAGILVYGLAKEFNVKDEVNGGFYGAAEKSAQARNAAYVLGSLLLMAGISVHIIF
jgi:uncharacterized repeat protein (TIGR02543 family)